VFVVWDAADGVLRLASDPAAPAPVVWAESSVWTPVFFVVMVVWAGCMLMLIVRRARKGESFVPNILAVLMVVAPAVSLAAMESPLNRDSEVTAASFMEHRIEAKYDIRLLDELTVEKPIRVELASGDVAR